MRKISKPSDLKLGKVFFFGKLCMKYLSNNVNSIFEYGFSRVFFFLINNNGNLLERSKGSGELYNGVGGELEISCK